MSTEKELKEHRKLTVLGHIIHEYVSDPVPVSSKVVAVRMGNSVSSATIRNIMAELEEEALIFQPHTSAGRVPTHEGYRRFVNVVKSHIELKRKEAERLREEYTDRIRTIQEVIEMTSFIISRELHGAGIVMWPAVENLYLKHLELIKVNARTVMAVLVTMTNAVKNYIIKLDVEIGRSDLEVISNYINDKYETEKMANIYDGLTEIIRETSAGHYTQGLGLARAALGVIDSIIRDNIDNQIYWEGLSFFMEEPEFQNIERTRRVFNIFSRREDIVSLMKKEMPDKSTRIYIGGENECEMLKDCTMITSGYSMKGKTIGRFGVIGPTRMDYERSLGIINLMSELISFKLEEING